MADPRFYVAGDPLTLQEAARLADATLSGGGGVIARVAGLEETDLADAVVFVEAEEIVAKLNERRIGLCLASPSLAPALRICGPIGLTAAPRLGFARLAAKLHRERPFGLEAGIHPTAEIAPDARVHETAVVAAGARIGPGVFLGPHAVIGPGVEIGEGSRIESGASVTHALLGARVVVLPGARIGQAGFGFVPTPQGLVRMPQLGRVIVGDDVEIGADTTIDRGALGDTVIGEGVKIDNLVQIGHNVRIGPYTVIAAQVGISGSCVIGARVMLGGKVGLADHVTVGDDAQIAAGSGVMRDIGPGEKWGGYPARPFRTWFRETATLSKLSAKTRRKAEDDGA